MATRLTFFQDFNCVINNNRIEVIFQNQTFHLQHPPAGRRFYFHDPYNSFNVVLCNMVLQVSLLARFDILLFLG
jgi:hypothetical protein